ncbi:M4 family metallopeptidase [Bacillus safensis]|uniref:M4 family metallopeptidase n=1 Tax=Bacillus safensis TaxID=561879 RepID=UPI0038274736
MDKDHLHKDGFVPKHLLKKLAKEGNEEAEKTLVKMASIEQKKTNAVKNDSSEVHSFIDSTQAQRLIYDSENTKEFKRKLVREEGGPLVSDENVNFAYDLSGQTLDYLKNKLGRNSINDQGMNLIFNVHYDENLNNAMWIPNLEQMAFGDGDGKLFINFTRSIDVIAHEMAHGVTQFVNELAYSHQSGALNEHFSDVIGSAVKQHVKGQTAETADWLIGDEIVGPTFPGKALRSMKEPGTAHQFDKQPAHFDDYRELPFDEENDWGGVHLYSGIPNKAFYLVSLEIGTDRAAFLWYTAWHNRQIIRPNAKFVEAFEAIIKTAETLTGQGKLPQQTVSVVENAFRQVGIKSPVTV